MFGLDEWIAELGQAHPLLLATLVAALLGLRHATDPDHLSAVTTLVAGDDDRRRSHAARLGLAWGAGHATTLVLFGIPIVIASSYLPERVLEAAEVLIGFVIIALAVRLLVRWRRRRVHLHSHRHGDVEHTHPHEHAHSAAHEHAHAASRTPVAAYGIGVVHGLGGSGGVGILLLASISSKPLAVAALLVFAALTAVSMAICSGALGTMLSTRRATRRFDTVAPALGLASAAFGAWYIAAAISLAPYPF
jgi:high-affinity nickel permease